MSDLKAALRSDRRILTMVAVPAVLAATLVGCQRASDPAPTGPTATSPTATSPTATSPTATSPIASKTPGATSSGQDPISGVSSSCVEGYNLTTVKGRAFAFDGTVTGTAPMQAPTDGSQPLPDYLTVTFTVNEWFRGGDQPTVAVDMMSGSTTGAVSSNDGPTYGVGTRLLVSGEPRFGGSPLQDPVAWNCGFTRPYDQTTAVSWR